MMQQWRDAMAATNRRRGAAQAIAPAFGQVVIAVILSAITGTSALASLPPEREPASFRLNGQPFFPIGLWGASGYPGGDSPYLHMDELAQTGFSVFDWYLSWLSTAEAELARLDAAQAAGMTIRYTIYQWHDNWEAKKPVIQNLLSQIKNHPALFGYRTADEPEWLGCTYSYATLLDMKTTVEAVDPNHLISLNFCDLSYDEGILNCCSSDGQIVACTVALKQQWLPIGSVYSMDVYPRGHPLSIVADTWVRLRDEIVNNPAVPLSIIEVGRDTTGLYSNSTLAGVRFMAFDAITEGCKGIEWYGQNQLTTTSNMWIYIKTVAKELSELKNVLAAGLTIAPADYTVPSSLSVICKQYPSTCSGKRYVIVTNPSSTARNNQQLVVPTWTGPIEKQNSGGGWTVVGSGTSITADFIAWDTHVYRADASITPGQASNPNPPDGSIFFLLPSSQLTWMPGTRGKLQRLYLDSDQSQVSSRASVVLKWTDTTGTQSSYSPLGLQKTLTYYWCVDTTVGDCTTSGGIWSFAGRYQGDFDGDGDVDQEDFGYFQACLSGANQAQDDPACINARLDNDTDVDADDFTRFLNCMRGANVLAELDCAD